MALLQVSDRIWYLPHDEMGDRPVLGYARGDRHALMVDAGNSPAHAEQFLDELQNAGLPKPDLIALTHAHWDHCFGLSAIPAISFASRRTQAALSAMSGWRWSDDAMQARLKEGEEIPFSDRAIRQAYPDPEAIRVKTADVTFKNRLTIDLGGLTCELLRIDNSHSADSVIAYLREESFVFLGDICCENLRLPVPRHEPDKLASLIGNLEALSFDRAIEGHSGLLRRETLLRGLRQELAQ